MAADTPPADAAPASRSAPRDPAERASRHAHVEREAQRRSAGARQARPARERARSWSSQWADKVKRAKKYWEPVFNRMKADQDFAAGYQWSKEEKDDRYTANLTLRIIRSGSRSSTPRTPSSKRSAVSAFITPSGTTSRPRWCRSSKPRPAISQQVAMGVMDPMRGAAGAARRRCRFCKTPPGSSRRKKQLGKMGKTLELLFRANIDARAARLQADDEDDGAPRVDHRRRLPQARLRTRDAEEARDRAAHRRYFEPALDAGSHLAPTSTTTRPTRTAPRPSSFGCC